MNEILFGAGIALISSLALAILGYLYQANLAQRHRKWQIEDRNYQRGLEILINRLKQAEDYLNHQYLLAQTIMTFEFKLITQLNKNLTLKGAGIDPILTNVTNEEVSIQNLRDETLIALNKNLIDCVFGEIEVADSLNKKIKKDMPYDSKKETKRINDFFTKATSIRRKMMQRIDELGRLEKNN